MLEPRQLLSSTLSFAPHVDFAVGTSPVALVAADFNGDGNQDLAIADDVTDKVYVYFGTGTGSFTAGPVLSLSAPPVAMITGDFTGSGLPDIAVACTAGLGQSTTSVDVFVNTGGGTFGVGQITTVETGATTGETVALAAGDFNQDGHLDLAVTDYTNELVSILSGNGNGTFAAPVNYTLGGANPTAIAAGDFEGNDYPDLAVTNTTTSTASGVAVTTNQVSVLVGSSSGAFSAGPTIPLPSTGIPTSIAAANLTGTASPGLIVADSNGNATLFTNSSGAFSQSAQATLGAGSTALATTDFDLDGNTDFVSADGGSSTSPTNSAVTVVQGAGSGNIGTTYSFPAGADPVDAVVADFNNDGKPDIATANGLGGTVSILLNSTALPPISTTTALTVNSTSVPGGSPVTMTATIAAARTSPLTGEEVPTGSVNFYDGSTLLSTVDLATGASTATFTTSTLPPGTFDLHAAYSGDTAYSASKAPEVVETITPTATDGPDLIGSIVSSTLPGIVAPGESGTLAIELTNAGNTEAVGAISNSAYLSLDTALDSGDTHIVIRGALARTSVHLKAGQSIKLVGTITIPAAIPLADYYLLVQLNSTDSISEAAASGNVAVSPGTYAAEDVFGTVGGRKGVALSIADGNGTIGTFKLTGPGTGTVNVGDEGVDLILADTTAASTVTLTNPRGTAYQLNEVTASSAVGSLRVATATVTNLLSLPEGVGSISLGTLGTAGGSGAGIILGGGTVKSIAITSVPIGTLSSSGGISALSVGNWAAGSINAAWIGSLQSKKNLSAALELTGAGAPAGVALNSVSVAGTLGGAGDDWTIVGATTRVTAAAVAASWVLDAGAVKSITVTGNFSATIDAQSIASLSFKNGASNAAIYADSSIGTMLVHGALTSSSIYAGINQAGSIASLRVIGPATAVSVYAGVDENSAGVPTSLRTDGSIVVLDITGAVDSASRFDAATLPIKPIFTGTLVDPATDPRFTFG